MSGEGKKASKMKEREGDEATARTAPKIARGEGPVQEWHEGRPRRLWSFQTESYVDTWQLGLPGEKGPSGVQVDVSGWDVERRKTAGFYVSPPKKSDFARAAVGQASSASGSGSASGEGWNPPAAAEVAPPPRAQTPSVGAAVPAETR